MRILLKFALFSLLSLSYGLGAQAVTITAQGCNGGTSGLTTCVPGANVVTFDSGTMPSNYVNTSGSGGQVVSGSLANYYSQPGGPTSDQTPYLAIPDATSSGAVTATLGTSYNYFGLYWGTMDTFNSMSFLNNGALVYSLTGADVLANLNLNQIAAGSNQYINFFFGPSSYNQVVFSSNGRAFESDNHAYASVPAPFAAGLFVFALGITLYFSWRRRIAVCSR